MPDYDNDIVDEDSQEERSRSDDEVVKIADDQIEDEISTAESSADAGTSKGRATNSSDLSCCLCVRESTGAHACSKCEKIVHATCRYY